MTIHSFLCSTHSTHTHTHKEQTGIYCANKKSYNSVMIRSGRWDINRKQFSHPFQINYIILSKFIYSLVLLHLCRSGLGVEAMMMRMLMMLLDGWWKVDGVSFHVKIDKLHTSWVMYKILFHFVQLGLAVCLPTCQPNWLIAYLYCWDATLAGSRSTFTRGEYSILSIKTLKKIVAGGPATHTYV